MDSTDDVARSPNHPVLSHIPEVSLVVPVFNEPRTVLEESLASVRAQTMTNFECIVIDESTDTATSDACREICARDNRFVYRHPDQRIGLAASLNLGIAMARAPLIARFDSDDICVADRLELQARFMADHPDIGVLGGALDIMDESGTTQSHRLYATDHETIERRFHTTNAIAHPTVMMRKALLDQHGGYDPDFRYAEDLDLWLRLLNQGVRFANLRDMLVRYRQQHTSRSARHWEYNLRARRSNLRPRFILRRLSGIGAIYVWSKLPASVQHRVFHGLLLRHV